MIPGEKSYIMEAAKTYCTGLFAWLLLFFKSILPTTCGEWGDLFNTSAAFLALVLVVLRFKNDICQARLAKKKRPEDDLE